MFPSGSSSRIKIGTFPRAIKCLNPWSWVAHGRRHQCLRLSSVETAHGKTSRLVAWLHHKVWPWTLGNTVRLMIADVCLMKNGALHWVGLDMDDVDIFRLIWSKGLARNGRENARNGRKHARNGREKNVYHLTWPFWFWTLIACHVFLKTIFAHGPNRRHGPKRRPRRGVMSLWVACCFSLFLGSSPSHLWVHTRVSFIPFYLDPRCANFCFFFHVFMLCVCFVLWLWCFCVGFECLARGFFGWKNSMPDYWCGVVWKLCYGWRLCAWGSLR